MTSKLLSVSSLCDIICRLLKPTKILPSGYETSSYKGLILKEHNNFRGYHKVIACSAQYPIINVSWIIAQMSSRAHVIMFIEKWTNCSCQTTIPDIAKPSPGLFFFIASPLMSHTYNVTRKSVDLTSHKRLQTSFLYSPIKFLHVSLRSDVRLRPMVR